MVVDYVTFYFLAASLCLLAAIESSQDINSFQQTRLSLPRARRFATMWQRRFETVG